jgi:hypothetical protein
MPQLVLGYGGGFCEKLENASLVVILLKFGVGNRFGLTVRLPLWRSMHWAGVQAKNGESE